MNRAPFWHIIVSFIVMVVACAVQCAAQQPVFNHYSVDDGLPSNTVYNITQDSQGYLWFATGIGVSRFDGHEFRNFDFDGHASHNR